MRLEGKVAIITGSAAGIGRETALRFAREGARVVVSDMVEDKGEAVAAEIVAAGGEAIFVRVNVTDRGSTDALAAAALARFGHIDILVNNAGITRDALIHKMSDADWGAVIAVNLGGVFNLTRAVAPIMMEAGSGAIVSISSVVGLDGNIGQSNYAATKGGVVAMTKGWAKEFARKGAKVRVNAVSPGYTRTPMIESVPEKVLEPIISRTPLGRLGEIQDIANAVLFLASEEAAFVTGQVLRVDGGLVL